jgi:hypothetical protein
MQNLVSAIQNNDPGAVPSYADLTYVPDAYYSGQVSMTQVAAFIDNAIRNYNLAGAFAGLISYNPYNLWNTNFVASLAGNPYLSATSLLTLITNGAMSGNSAQLVLYALVQNYYNNKWIYTVTANAPSSITFSTNAVLSTNVLIAQNITIASGVTVTCGTHTCFFIAQSFNNYGTVVSPLGATGGLPGQNNGPGGTGGGGVVIIAYTAVLGAVNVAGNYGGAVGSLPQLASGVQGVAGVFYIVSGMTVPLGGTGGGGSYGGAAGHNGGGGGATSYIGGAGGNATVYSFSNPNAMVTYILQGLSDWWLINVLDKAPSSTTPLAFMYGSGGGGASCCGGGGGGGGGEVVVYGYNILSGNINAAGGTGGSGTYGGGGGGGGLVFLLYGATSGSVTVNVAGGIGQGGGATGAPGTAYIAPVTVNG